MAKAVAPEVSYQIGQYFKGNDYINGKLNTNLPEEGSAPHILAHGILAAAVSAATGNDVTTGALSAMGAEAGAKVVAQYLYPNVKPSDLTADQKQTVSSIASLAGLAVGGSTGDVGSAVNAGETAKVAVEDNAAQAAGVACGPAAALCFGGITLGMYLATPTGQENLKKGAAVISDYSSKAYNSVRDGIYSTVDDYYLDELKGLRSGGDGRLSGDVSDLRDIINGISKVLPNV